MKAISLWQPWASAIALGLKRIETRSWPTSYRGRLAIHAAKTTQHVNALGVLLRDAGEEKRAAAFRDMPFGFIVATCEITGCVSTERLLGSLTRCEHAFGDYSAGRFGWVLKNIVPLVTPIPFRGVQGLFEVPDELLAAPVQVGPSDGQLGLFDARAGQ